MVEVPKADIVQVRVLYTEGCPSTPETLSLIERIARQSLIPIRLEALLVDTEEQAEKLRFMGSPTVQINGVDLDPRMRDKTAFGFA